jgi:protein transport protein SEC24
MYDSDKEKQLFAPRDRFWVDIGEDCAEEGIGISMFLGMSQFADVGSIGRFAGSHAAELVLMALAGTTTSLTGGDLFFHPRFESKRDIASLHSQLRRLFTRTTGYNCIVRIRSSSGTQTCSLTLLSC